MTILVNYKAKFDHLFKEFEHTVYQIRKFDLKEGSEEYKLLNKIMQSRKLYFNVDTIAEDVTKETVNNLSKDLVCAKELLKILQDTKSEMNIWVFLLSLVAIMMLSMLGVMFVNM